MCAQHRRTGASVTRNWPWYTPSAAKIDGLVERAQVALARHALGQGRYASDASRRARIDVPETIGRIVREVALLA